MVRPRRAQKTPGSRVSHSRATRRRGAEIALSLLLAASLPLRARADEPSGDDWRPSLAISLKAQQQRAEAEISSTLATSSEGTFNPVPIPLDAKEHDDAFTAIIPIELQLQTPEFSLGVGGRRARGFVQAAYQWVPITERDFLTEGKFLPLPPNPTAASQGLGGEVRVDFQHQWSLSAGIAVPIEIEGFPIEIRPSIDYVGQWVRVDAKTIGVDASDQVFTLDDDDNGAIHFLGPRLSVETDAGRWGFARMTVFAEGSILFADVFGSQDLGGATSQGGETMRFDYDPDDLLFQIGVGTRIYWDPR